MKADHGMARTTECVERVIVECSRCARMNSSMVLRGTVDVSFIQTLFGVFFFCLLIIRHRRRVLSSPHRSGGSDSC